MRSSESAEWVGEDMSNVTVSLDLMPAFYYKNLGLKFGEAYYFDPGYREKVEQAKGKFLRGELGAYGVGDPTGASAHTLFIQPVDLIMRTQGAEWRFPDDATVESAGQPWARLSPEEIAKIDPRSAAFHPVVDACIDQYRDLRRLYGDEADIFFARSGIMNVHTPYTTAHQLCGEELFVLMTLEPDQARMILDKIWEIYEVLYARIAEAVGVKFTKIHMGDCAAAMLSPDLYRDVVLPSNRAAAAKFEKAGYHSCGPSSHLVKLFREVTEFENIQLGPGTDLPEAVRLFPRSCIEPLIDPVQVRNGTPESLSHEVSKVLGDLRQVEKVTLCAWAFDRETRMDNVRAIYETVCREAVMDFGPKRGGA